MSLSTLTTNLDHIQALDDLPNAVGGLTADELKAEFDKAGNDIKTYINNTLIPGLESTAAGASGAKSIGIESLTQLSGVTNVMDAITGILAMYQSGTVNDGDVTTPKLANGAVTTAKLASGAVTGAKCDFANGLTVAGNLTVGGSASITGGFTAGSTVFLAENVSYGNNLPPNANASKGRIFFKKLT